uniref:Uncharacterized protein n=1 Tax=Anguilla anguilla TaxID=7936 RepID=A0A0E9UYJ4_ANGAN
MVWTWPHSSHTHGPPQSHQTALYSGAWLRLSVLQVADYAILSCQRGLWPR